MAKRVCVIGAGISGLGAAWALNRHPGRFDVHVLERNNRIGGNAFTADIPQADGSTIPIDVSVTAFIPEVYPLYVALLKELGIDQVPTRFSYAVHYGDDTYAHDLRSPLGDRLADDIRRFRGLLAFLAGFNALSKRPSVALAALNPFNYLSMGWMLDRWSISDDFRYEILKPLFINFVLASDLFTMPASLFARYMDYFDVQASTPMVTWQGGTRAVYERMTRHFENRIHLARGAQKVHRDRAGVLVRDETGHTERFDEVIFACNADQALALLDGPSALERFVLGKVRYDDRIHGEAIVHTDGAVLPDGPLHISRTRSTFLRHWGTRPDNYEITYIMHNQQPWANHSDRPCLVTYNPEHPIDEAHILTRVQFRHAIHTVFHMAILLNAFPLLQGRHHTWYAGAHTAVNSQEHCLLSGLAAARRLGAAFPFPGDPDAEKWFRFYGRLMHGPLFPHRSPGPC